MKFSLLKKEKAGKLEYLDGLRGLMAINVVICHFICVYYPQMYFEEFANNTPGFLSMFAKTPLSILVNGDIAVRYFFVLTGFLVGMSVFTKSFSKEDVLKKCVRRYTRLLPIVLITTLITYLTMVLGLQYHLQITDSVANGDFLRGYCNFSPSIKDLLMDIFIDPFRRKSDFVGPFWTIKYEFWGYILSLISCYFLKDLKFRRIAYVILSVIVFLQFSPKYVSFFLGVFVADLLYNKNETLLGKKYEWLFDRNWFLIICFVFGLYFAACPIYYAGIYSFWKYIPLLSPSLLRSVGIVMVFFVILKSSILQKIFSLKIFKHLGNISYEIYAIHWPLMLSLEAGVFMLLRDKLSYDIAACLSFVIVLPMIYILAMLMSLFVKTTGILFQKGKSKLFKGADNYGNKY